MCVCAWFWFVSSILQLVSNLKRADRQLEDLQQPRASEILTIEKFDDWQVHVKVRSNSFITMGQVSV